LKAAIAPAKYSRQSAAEGASATSVSWIALPVSSVSMRARSALRARRMSAARRRMRPRSTGFSRAQAGWAARAASIASSRTFGVAECSVAMVSPVAG